MPIQAEARVPGIRPTRQLLPLIGLISGPITPLVAATPVTPNQLTWLSLAAGLGAQVYWLLIFVKGARDNHV